jgi:hypothetical protein
MHQQHVHHRGFVDNEQIAVERIRVVSPEAAALPAAMAWLASNKIRGAIEKSWRKRRAKVRR